MAELQTLNGLTHHLRNLRLSREWLKAEALAGRLPCLQIGRKLYFNPAAVEAALIRRAAEGSVREEGVACEA